jgi:hypothetical protein
MSIPTIILYPKKLINKSLVMETINKTIFTIIFHLPPYHIIKIQWIQMLLLINITNRNLSQIMDINKWAKEIWEIQRLTWISIIINNHLQFRTRIIIIKVMIRISILKIIMIIQAHRLIITMAITSLLPQFLKR